MDGIELALKEMAGLEFKSPPAHLSHLTSLSSPEPLPLNTGPWHMETQWFLQLS